SCFADQPGSELKIRTARHNGHARPIGQPNKRPDAEGKVSNMFAFGAHCGPQECGQIHPRRMGVSKRRESLARQTVCSRGAKFVARWKFSKRPHGRPRSKISACGPPLCRSACSVKPHPIDGICNYSLNCPFISPGSRSFITLDYLFNGSFDERDHGPKTSKRIACMDMGLGL